MAKDKYPDSKLVNQHKRMAEGEKITGMKTGGSCMNKGGMAKKTKKKK